MSLSTLSLIVFLASSAIECAKTLKPSEICACVPLNICPEINRFNKEDAKYFATVLKCKEGFIRCCPNNESVNSALRRFDNEDNVIMIDEDFIKKDLSRTDEIETTTESVDLTTLEIDTTTETLNELLTTEIPSAAENVETFENKRKSKFINNNISVVYPNTKGSKKKTEVMEHLFLIFPNGEIEAALATATGASLTNENSSIKPMKRVIVRKRLIKKTGESLEGAESKISESVIEPKQMDIEEVKKRLSDMYRHDGRKNHLSSTATTTTTGSPVEETTALKQRRKRIKFRKETTAAAASPVRSSASLRLNSMEKVETSTVKSRRKIIYDASSRTNFLKRPSSQHTHIDDDEPFESEMATTAEVPTESAINYLSLETVVTTPMPRDVIKHSNPLDNEHKAMIEAVYKTLSAIHSGVDIKLVEKMIESHKSRMEANRKNPPETVAISGPTRPYRGSATFRKPATNQPIHDEAQTQGTGMRTRNLSRTRSTVTTHQTTHKSTRKAPRTVVSHQKINPILNSNSLLEEVDMPPKQKPPLDFRASPLFGITIDKFNDFDNDMIDKIHETLRSPTGNQNGFFPVIENGTPSTLL